MPVDEKKLQELKLAVARLIQQWAASKKLMNIVRLSGQASEECLADWENRLMPLARRSKKNPVLYCERVLVDGPDWFSLPKGTTSRQVRVLLEIVHAITSFFSEVKGIDELDGKMILKWFQTLTQEPPGRPRKEEFERALELKRSKKGIRAICRELNREAYAQMDDAAKLIEHHRVQSGIARLEQKQKDKTQVTRNTSP